MCRNGVEVSESLAYALRQRSVFILRDPGLRCCSMNFTMVPLPDVYFATFSEVFVNPETGKVYKEGESYKCPALADTLERIAVDPEDFYSGETARMLIDDLTALGGQMNLEDLKNYTCVFAKGCCSCPYRGFVFVETLQVSLVGPPLGADRRRLHGSQRGASGERRHPDLLAARPEVLQLCPGGRVRPAHVSQVGRGPEVGVRGEDAHGRPLRPRDHGLHRVGMIDATS